MKAYRTHCPAISGQPELTDRRDGARANMEQPRGPRPRAPQQRACPPAGLAATPTRGRAGIEATSLPQESAGTASDLPSEQPSCGHEREQSTVQNLSDARADHHGYRSCSQ